MKHCKPLELQFEILPMLRPTKQIAHHSKFSRGNIQTREQCRNCEVCNLNICFGRGKNVILNKTEKQKFTFFKADDNYIEHLIWDM